jgi:hypothetical protein
LRLVKVVLGHRALLADATGGKAKALDVPKRRLMLKSLSFGQVGIDILGGVGFANEVVVEGMPVGECTRLKMYVIDVLQLIETAAHVR